MNELADDIEPFRGSDCIWSFSMGRHPWFFKLNRVAVLKFIIPKGLNVNSHRWNLWEGESNEPNPIYGVEYRCIGWMNWRMILNPYRGSNVYDFIPMGFAHGYSEPRCGSVYFVYLSTIHFITIHFIPMHFTWLFTFNHFVVIKYQYYEHLHTNSVSNCFLH